MDVKRATKHLRCGSLEEDEAFLRKVYSRHADSISALDAANGMQVTASSSTEPLPAASGKATLPPAPSEAGF